MATSLVLRAAIVCVLLSSLLISLSVANITLAGDDPYERDDDDIGFSNVWAVRLAPEANPEKLLSRFGFSHFRALRLLGDNSVHSFHLTEQIQFFKRSFSTTLFFQLAQNITNALLKERGVLWAEQQTARFRSKRQAPSFSDPLFSRQWNLVGTRIANTGVDLNLAPLWAEGIHGENTTVAIVDDGMEADHPEIEAQYNFDGSWNVLQGNTNVRPGAADQDGHGTKCGGTATGRNNTICGVGVAYRAKVSAIRLIDSARRNTDLEEAEALGYRPDINYIYSASWGPPDDAQRLEGPGKLLQAVFEHNIKYERNGLGSIYIWANGNGGRALDNCNFDGYANSRYTISITATNQEGTKPWYTEQCAATVAAAPGGSFGPNDIIAPSLRKTCVTNFGETSSAAPQAAGIAAMMLQMNPRLNWREFQDIFIRTARKNAPNDPDWKVNGAGYHVNHNFGYGLIDATAAVHLARAYDTTRHQMPYLECSIESQFSRAVTVSARSSASQNLVVTATNCQVVYIEHVVVQLWVTTASREQLEVTLNSPMRTPSVLASIHGATRRQQDYSGWNFTSLRHWDEKATGTWSLTLRAGGEASHSWTKWKLSLFGTDGTTLAPTTSPLPTTTTPQPTTTTPEPTTTTPEPTTPLPTTTDPPTTTAEAETTPEVTTTTPEPTTTTPEPTTTTPEPTTTTPEPTTTTPEPTTTTPELTTTTPQPTTTTPEPTTTTPKPTTTTPLPTTTTPEPTTTTPETTTTPQPTTTTPALTTTTPQPTTTTPEPTTTTPEPTTTTPAPPTTTSAPTTSSSAPTTTAAPTTLSPTTTAPIATTPEPTTTTPDPTTPRPTSANPTTPTPTTPEPTTRTPPGTFPTQPPTRDTRFYLIAFAVSSAVVLTILVAVTYVVYLVCGSEDEDVRSSLLANVDHANGFEPNGTPMQRLGATPSALLAGEENNFPHGRPSNEDA